MYFLMNGIGFYCRRTKILRKGCYSIGKFKNLVPPKTGWKFGNYVEINAQFY
jgi:hypothetical protein